MPSHSLTWCIRNGSTNCDLTLRQPERQRNSCNLTIRIFKYDYTIFHKPIFQLKLQNHILEIQLSLFLSILSGALINLILWLSVHPQGYSSLVSNPSSPHHPSHPLWTSTSDSRGNPHPLLSFPPSPWSLVSLSPLAERQGTAIYWIQFRDSCSHWTQLTGDSDTVP